MLEEMVYTGLWKGLSKQERLEYAGRKVYREVGEKACLYRKVLIWVCSKKGLPRGWWKVPSEQESLDLSMLEEMVYTGFRKSLFTQESLDLSMLEEMVCRGLRKGPSKQESLDEYAWRKVYREVCEKSLLKQESLDLVCREVCEKSCLNRKVLTRVCWRNGFCIGLRKGLCLYRKVLSIIHICLKKWSAERFMKSPV